MVAQALPPAVSGLEYFCHALATPGEVRSLAVTARQMPVMDGLEAAAEIRRLEGAAGVRVPILACTAGAMHEDVERCRAAGADGHIAKPIRARELLAAVEEVLRVHALPRA